MIVCFRMYFPLTTENCRKLIFVYYCLSSVLFFCCHTVSLSVCLFLLMSLSPSLNLSLICLCQCGSLFVITVTLSALFSFKMARHCFGLCLALFLNCYVLQHVLTYVVMVRIMTCLATYPNVHCLISESSITFFNHACPSKRTTIALSHPQLQDVGG